MILSRRLLVPLGAALLLAGCSRPEPAPEPVRAVRTLVVGEDSMGGAADYAAEVRARTESRLSFRVAGKMVRRAVDLGDTVEAGQVLAQLDPQDLKLSQDAARAAMQAAQVEYDLAAADFKRYQQLRDQNFISSAELERRETTLKSARAQFEQARAQASVQLNQAAYANLVADTAGVVTGVDAEPGAVLAAGAPVLRLAHDGPRDVVFSVPEDRLAGIQALRGKPGAVKLKLWSQDAPPLPATVREIAAATDPVTRTFLVKADAGTANLRLGQTASVLVERPGRDGVVKLPLAAVFEHGGGSAVWLVDPSTMLLRLQPIAVAGTDGTSIVVGSGLAAGQRVVSAGVHVLTAGQKVTLYVEPGAGAGSAPARR